MDIDFDTINQELETKDLTLSQAETVLNDTINLKPFIDASSDFEIVDRESANQALSMSLQARKMRQNLDKTRADIVRPHYDFQKAVNKLAKSFEQKLQEIEHNLSGKIKQWMKDNRGDNLLDLMAQNMKVEDGSLTKKMKWIFEIEDESQIPKEFLSIDEKKIQMAIKGGIRNIPGVKIFENLEIEMRVKN